MLWHNLTRKLHLRYRLQVFRTAYTGWGLRCLDHIPKGAFVCQYVGEVINDEAANNTENDTYLFELQTRENLQAS